MVEAIRTATDTNGNGHHQDLAGTQVLARGEGAQSSAEVATPEQRLAKAAERLGRLAPEHRVLATELLAIISELDDLALIQRFLAEGHSDWRSRLSQSQGDLRFRFEEEQTVWS